jgi:outer membrane biosynthesis protein TonB
MRRRDPTILLALCLALLAHLLLLRAGERAARRDLGWWLWGSQAVAQAAVLPISPKHDPLEQIGDHNQSGTSINSAPGLAAMESVFTDPHQEQALMTRDPVGFKGHSGKTLAQVLSGENGDGSPKNPTAPAADQSAEMFASAENALNAAPAHKSAQPDPLSSGPLKPTDDKVNPTAAKQQTQKTDDSAHQRQVRSAPTGGGKPGPSSDAASGSPLPSSNFESFPVTHISSRFVAGKIVAREGRKLLMPEIPHLSFAAWADLASIPDPHVVLQLKIDDTGSVTDVRTIHSSGSDNIDLPCEHAAATWVFETLIDPATGKPRREETIEFTIFF